MSVTESVTVKVNGEARQLPSGLSIAAMLGELGLSPQRVAVERNREIVARSTLADLVIAEGDAFEIVHFVGGG